MNIVLAQIADRLPFFFCSCFSLQHSIRGVSSFRLGKIWQHKQGFRGALTKKMAWNLEKCESDAETQLGLVRPATDDFVKEAVEALKAGKVIAVPTDTLYGFACDAWDDPTDLQWKRPRMSLASRAVGRYLWCDS